MYFQNNLTLSCSWLLFFCLFVCLFVFRHMVLVPGWFTIVSCPFRFTKNQVRTIYCCYYRSHEVYSFSLTTCHLSLDCWPTVEEFLEVCAVGDQQLLLVAVKVLGALLYCKLCFIEYGQPSVRSKCTSVIYHFSEGCNQFASTSHEGVHAVLVPHC